MIERVLCRCTPRRKNRAPVLLAGLLLTAGFAVWLCTPQTGWWALARFGALLPIGGGLYLAMRWLARRYSYSIEQHECGQVDFVVTEQNGYRQSTVCRVSLDAVTALRPTRKGEKLPRPVYRYVNEPRPKQTYLLIFADAADAVTLCFTPDEPMQRLLALLCPAKNAQDFPGEFTEIP